MKRPICELLIEYRTKHKISQRKMAKFLEVSQSQLSLWERQLHIPNELRTMYLLHKMKESNGNS